MTVDSKIPMSIIKLSNFIWLRCLFNRCLLSICSHWSALSRRESEIPLGFITACFAEPGGVAMLFLAAVRGWSWFSLLSELLLLAFCFPSDSLSLTFTFPCCPLGGGASTQGHTWKHQPQAGGRRSAGFGTEANQGRAGHGRQIEDWWVGIVLEGSGL